MFDLTKTAPKNYDEANKVTTEDLIGFMKTRPAEEVAEFKAFVAELAEESAPKTPSFFNVRKWVLEKYFPAIPKKEPKKAKNFVDLIMSL